MATHTHPSTKAAAVPVQTAMSNKAGKLTPGRIVLLRELHKAPGGILSFGQLRMAYFGKERGAGNKATTAFYMALQRVIEFLWIDKNPEGGYRLSEAGKDIIEAELKKDPRAVDRAQSQAALKYHVA